MIKFGFILLFFNQVFCYNHSILQHFISKKTNLKINRRNILLLPILYPLKVNAEKKKSIDELREEANRIIEIIEAQKENFNLPELKKEKANNNKIVDLYKNEEIENKLTNILDILKNSKIDPINALNKLKDIASDSNSIKNTNTKRLLNLFQDSKYALLLGNFVNYEILSYNKYNINDFEYCDVDVIIKAKYNTLLQYSIQFNDIYYPPPSSEKKDLLCHVIYRWSFIKENNEKYKLQSCILLPKKTD